ncbi:MAG: endonuclease/exonuclease/phosphatase family protein [Paludibacter sp.]|nr:endonuclease/exonuclease/phosphatase family protein [Paludibacter sp.]
MKFLNLIFIAFTFSIYLCNAETKDNSLFKDTLIKNNEKIVDFSKEQGTQRFLCYNVRHCEGMDSIINYDRIANIISTLDGDFVALQELDSASTRSKGINMVKELGDKLGMHAYFGAAISYKGGKYGVGILSKKPAQNIHQYKLSGSEPRTFLIAEYEDFLIISVHLDLMESNRVESVEIITEKIKALNKKAYLAGDFNEDKVEGAMFTAFKKDWTIVSPIKNTFPTTGGPTKCIDFTLTYNPAGKYEIYKADVIYNLPGINVSVSSDHFPLYIDFKQNEY